MGRKRSVDYSPKEFEKLSTEERRMRGRLSTLKRMIKKREDDINELMKPILKKKEEIKKFSEELDGLKNSIKDLGFGFPTFRVEPFTTKNKDYYRGVWYVNGKKKQKYLGSEDKIHQLVKKKFRGFESLTYNEKTEKILEFFLPQFQLDYTEVYIFIFR
jgi:predicted RNase H-like nuclease (RuvC/YqgF family)